jgi:hypothetical protein
LRETAFRAEIKMAFGIAVGLSLGVAQVASSEFEFVLRHGIDEEVVKPMRAGIWRIDSRFPETRFPGNRIGARVNTSRREITCFRPPSKERCESGDTPSKKPWTLTTHFEKGPSKGPVLASDSSD